MKKQIQERSPLKVFSTLKALAVKCKPYCTKTNISKLFVVSLVGSVAILLWCIIDAGLRYATAEAAMASKEEGYALGYKDGADYVNNKLLSEFSSLLQVSLKGNNLCTKGKCAVADSLKDYILLEKQLHAIMKKSNEKLTKEQRREYAKYIIKYAKEFNLPPILIASIIHRESNFINKTTSSVGAKGPMQVWSKHHKEKMKRHNLKDSHLYTTQYGILVGCEVLKEYLDLEKGNYRAALYRYVGGKHHSYVRDIFKMCEYALSIKI